MVLGFAGALYLIWLYLTWLPGYLESPTPHDQAAGRICSLGPLYLRFPGIVGRRCRLGSTCGPGHFADQQPEAPDRGGLARDGAVHGARGHDPRSQRGRRLHRPGHVLRQRGHGQCMGTGHGDGPVGLCRFAGLDPELRGILRRLVCTCDHRQSRGFDRLLHAGSPVRSGRRRRVGARVPLSWFANRSRPRFWTAKADRPTDVYRVRAATNAPRTRTPVLSMPEPGIRQVRTPGPRE